MLTVEIWSDVVCPFCYMGKRRFDHGLLDFEHRDEVQVAWRSFQLDPSVRPVPGQTIYQYLADSKGITVEASRRMHDRLTDAAAELGLSYRFDTAVVANTFDAHRLTHLAKARGVQEKLEERLFAAYFTEGRDIGEHATLAELAADAGLDRAEARQILAGARFADEVRSDARQAAELGADGVPFFVFDRAMSVAGAQPSELFLEVLRTVWEEREAHAAAAQPSET
jgi:predicted DsbA family dithiol-disulfide isomerase